MPYISGAYTDSVPATAALGNRLYVAYKDNDSDHIYLASTSNPAVSSGWHIVDVNDIPVSPRSRDDEPVQIRTTYGPSLTTIGAQLWLTFKGHNNPLMWQVSLGVSSGGDYSLYRNGCLNHAQTARGPATAGPSLDPASMASFPMVAYRGNSDDGVWIHSYMPEPDFDMRLTDTHSEHAPAAAYAELRSQEAHFLAYTDQESQRVMFTHNFRPGRPGMPPGWSDPLRIPYGFTSRKPALAVHDDVLYLAIKSRIEDDYRIWISSWDEFWVAHGSMPNMFTNQGPALVSFRDSLYVVFKGHNNERVWCSEAVISRRNVRPAVVVSLGGATTIDIHSVVRECAEAHGYPLTAEINWLRDKGDTVAENWDARRIRDLINTLASRNGGDKSLLSLVVLGKSAGGVLAWNTFKRHFVPHISDFHRAALVMIDPHGSVRHDDRGGPYNQWQDLWWPSDWPSDTETFRVYNIYQYEGVPTGADFPDSRVYRCDRLSGSSIGHFNISDHETTCEMIVEAFKFALSGD